MRICVYEDLSVHNLEPLTLSRPAFDLLCGASSLLERQRRYFAANERGALVRPLLAELCRLDHPELAINDLAWLESGPVVMVNARWLPPANAAVPRRAPQVGLVEDQVAFVVLPRGGLSEWLPEAITDAVEQWKQTLPGRQVGGHLIHYPWNLIEHNGAALEQDFQRLLRGSGPGPVSGNLVVAGPKERLLVDSTAQIDPFVVADTTRGPVVIDRGAVVHAFSRLEGPCYIGRKTWVLGGDVRGSTIGPMCRVGGEVEASVFQGYSNKCHDGFVGHSYVGEWVNLGAGTQTSDLRNDYGPVTVATDGVKIDTGLLKVGAFIGDHTKTGLNTLLNTGTVVGPFCHLLPSASLLPKVVPAFCSYWHGQLQGRADLRQLFTTAATVMQRRDREWTSHHADFFLALYDYTAASRRRILGESEYRRLRRIG